MKIENKLEVLWKGPLEGLQPNMWRLSRVPVGVISKLRSMEEGEVREFWQSEKYQHLQVMWRKGSAKMPEQKHPQG